jgi:tetratricopeptide (TPR) repeat protein
MITRTEINGYLENFDYKSAIEACTREIETPTPPPRPAPQDYYCRGFSRCFIENNEKKYMDAIEDLSRALSFLRTPNPAPAVTPTPASALYHPIPNVLTEEDRYIKRAYAHYLNGNYQAAIDDCNMVIDHVPNPQNDAFANELMGIIYFNQKHHHEAVDHFRRALSLNAMSPGLLDKYREACKKLNEVWQ